MTEQNNVQDMMATQFLEKVVEKFTEGLKKSEHFCFQGDRLTRMETKLEHIEENQEDAKEDRKEVQRVLNHHNEEFKDQIKEIYNELRSTNKEVKDNLTNSNKEVKDALESHNLELDRRFESLYAGKIKNEKDILILQTEKKTLGKDLTLAGTIITTFAGWAWVIYEHFHGMKP